jgi:hypothetical protein
MFIPVLGRCQRYSISLRSAAGISHLFTMNDRFVNCKPVAAVFSEFYRKHFKAWISPDGGIWDL